MLVLIKTNILIIGAYLNISNSFIFEIGIQDNSHAKRHQFVFVLLGSRTLNCASRMLCSLVGSVSLFFIVPRHKLLTILPVFGMKWGINKEWGNIFHSIWYRCPLGTDRRMFYSSLSCVISQASLPHLATAQTHQSNIHFWAVLHEPFSISYTFQASICLNIVCALQIALNLCFKNSLNDFLFRIWKGNAWPYL